MLTAKEHRAAAAKRKRAHDQKKLDDGYKRVHLWVKAENVEQVRSLAVIVDIFPRREGKLAHKRD